jgi:hypothetical protein
MGAIVAVEASAPGTFLAPLPHSDRDALAELGGRRASPVASA